MTFAPSTTLTQDAVGRRMAFLALDAGVREKALERLRKGVEDPIAIAQTLQAEGTVIDIFADDKEAFATKLEALFGPGLRHSYLDGDDLLDANKRDTPDNRAHVLEFWQEKQAAILGLTDQIRQAFIQALEAQGPVRIRWGNSQVTGKPGTGVSFKSVGGALTVVMTVEPLA